MSDHDAKTIIENTIHLLSDLLEIGHMDDVTREICEMQLSHLRLLEKQFSSLLRGNLN